MTVDGALSGVFEPRPEWFDRALCAPSDGVVDPDMVAIFFPISSGEHRRELLVISPDELDAKALCAACPVRTECLEYGLDEPTGIWGGRTARERRLIRKRLRSTPA